MESRNELLIGMKIRNEITDWIYDTMPEVNGYHHSVIDRGTHIEIDIGIAIGFFHESVVLLLFSDTPINSVIENFKIELQKIYDKLTQ